MDKEKLMALLRNPSKLRKQPATQQQQTQPKQEAAQPAQKYMTFALGGVVLLVLLTVWFISSATKKADNITAFLDPNTLKGLAVDADYNPNAGQRYIQISEGQDRNVNVKELGTTLPVISRYNYRALTPKQYEIIGEAPYALSINVSSNIDDPDLLRYLFNQDNLCQKFIARPDVAPLLNDPATLAKLAADPAKVKAFLEDETVQQVLQSPELVKVLGGSRLFAYLLISKSVKYYRDRPAQAAQLINANPSLAALKKNPAVRQAVQDNHYLKNISATLLK